MNDYTSAQIAKYASFALPGKRNSSRSKFRTTCPIHGGKNSNFHFDLETGLWYCHSKCKQGGGIVKLEMLLTNTDYETAAKRVAEVVGASYSETRGSQRAVTSYVYVEANGKPVAEKVRYSLPDGKKSFSWRQPDGTGWKAGGGSAKVLYNLPSVITADTVLIVEGEKTADRLNRTQWSETEKFRLVATCGPDGSNGWLDSFSAYLAGKNVVILPDHDIPGEKHFSNVLASLSRMTAKPASIRVDDFSEFPEKFDAFDFLDQKTPAELLAKMRTAKDRLGEVGALPVEDEILVDMVHYASSFESKTDWIIEGVIHAKACGLIVANPKAGKSLSVLDLLLSLSTGLPWLGMPITRRLRTAYISREDHPETTMPRFKRLLSGKGCFSDPSGWMKYNSSLQMAEFYLDKDDQVDRMIRQLKKAGTEFAVFDVFRRLHLGDENDNSQIAKVLAGLTRIQREADCQVALVHHLNKASNEGSIFTKIRGASAIHGWAEWAIAIQGQVDEENGDETRKVEFETKAGRPHRIVHWRPIDGVDTLQLVRVENNDLPNTRPPTRSALSKARTQ